jgi:hypothetical protein
VTIEILVAHGADPEQADFAGRRPVDVARQYGKAAHVATLEAVMATRRAQREQR